MTRSRLNKDGKGVEKLLTEQTKTILNAVDHKFARFEVRMEKFESRVDRKFEEIDHRFDAIDHRFDAIEKTINNLTLTLDKFLRQLTEQNDKVKILTIKVERMASFIKEKFGVEITA